MIAVVVIITVIPLALSAQVFKRPELDSSVIVTMTADTAFERGHTQHLITAAFEQDNIQVNRGETVTVPFIINHKSHSFWQWVTVSDFQQSIKNYAPGGKYVDVTIHSFSPISAVILPNQSTQGLMTFSIDPSAPDEIVGKSVTLSVQFGSEVAFGGTHLDQGGSVTVQVTG